jgi:hypothetical protein
MVKDKCTEIGETLDVWAFTDRPAHDVITRHQLKGEYRLKTQTESSTVKKWSSMLAPVRIPPRYLILLEASELPGDLRDDDETCNKICSI